MKCKRWVCSKYFLQDGKYFVKFPRVNVNAGSAEKTVFALSETEWCGVNHGLDVITVTTEIQQSVYALYLFPTILHLFTEIFFTRWQIFFLHIF